MSAHSPSFVPVQAAADRALQSANGIEIRYTVEAHGSIEQCAHLARGFQKSFTALRARTRRLSQRMLGENTVAAYNSGHGSAPPVDTMAQGPYDSLVCQRSLLPDHRGWIVGLYPARHLLQALDIIDVASGKPITEIGLHQDELSALQVKFAKFDGSFTPADHARMLELDPSFADIPGGVSAPRPRPQADPLAELDLDTLSDFGQDDTTEEDQP